MNRPTVIAVVIAGGAALVYNGINVARFLSPPVASSSLPRLDDPTPKPEVEAASDLSPLGRAAIAELLASLGGDSKSPFHTRAELEALAAGEIADLPLPTPRFDGALLGRSQRIVWLDGVPFTEGDRVGRFVIHNIRQHAVLLRDDRMLIRVDENGATPLAIGEIDATESSASSSRTIDHEEARHDAPDF